MDENTVEKTDYGTCPECNEPGLTYNEDEFAYECPNGHKYSSGIDPNNDPLKDKIEECLGVEVISVEITLTLDSNKGVKVGEIITLPDAKYKVIGIHPDGQTVSVVVVN